MDNFNDKFILLKSCNLKLNIANIIFIYFLFFGEIAHCAVDQLLNDNFYQNPAELNTIKKMQFIVGNIFISPTFKFKGTTYGVKGSAKSHVNDYLPYFLSAYRVTDRFVLGLNITTSGYGHLDWPINSIVEKSSTLTKVRYERFGLQSSYQITDSLALGVGFNLESNHQYKLNFVIPSQGNQINSITGVNYTGDLGLYYKIDSNNYLTVAGYTQLWE